LERIITNKDGLIVGGQDGMDLRDYFAAKAMQSFLLDHEAVSCENSLIVISSWSYQYADAMMEARSK
jgi:hypothetical protein